MAVIHKGIVTANAQVTSDLSDLATVSSPSGVARRIAERLHEMRKAYDGPSARSGAA